MHKVLRLVLQQINMVEYTEPQSFVDRLHVSYVALATFGLLSLGSYFAFGVVFAEIPKKEPAKLVPVMQPSRVFMHAPQKPVAAVAHILFVGDMFFDRQIRFVGEQSGVDYPFSCVDSLLHSADFVVGNLEGPITSNPSVSFGTIPGSANNYRFTFPTSTAETLFRHNIKVVSNSNNHILNFGFEGLSSTRVYLDQAGVGYFGGVDGSEAVHRMEYNGISFSFVGYNEFGGSSPGDVANVIAKENKAGRVVIVFAHWGTEYSTSADDILPIATLFAENGAAAVVGAHPHVVGQSEKIGSTTVYYSLGNFIFDQYFSQAVTHGLAVMLTISKDGILEAKEYPTELERDGRTCLVQ